MLGHGSGLSPTSEPSIVSGCGDPAARRDGATSQDGRQVPAPCYSKAVVHHGARASTPPSATARRKTAQRVPQHLVRVG